MRAGYSINTLVEITNSWDYMSSEEKEASATQMLRILNLVMDEKDFLLMLEECYGKHRKENYTSTFD